MHFDHYVDYKPSFTCILSRAIVHHHLCMKICCVLNFFMYLLLLSRPFAKFNASIYKTELHVYLHVNVKIKCTQKINPFTV